jgi:hypothetical protein
MRTFEPPISLLKSSRVFTQFVGEMELQDSY